MASTVPLFERVNRARYFGEEDNQVSISDDIVEFDEEVSLEEEQGIPVRYPTGVVKEKAEIADFALGPDYSPGLLRLEEMYTAGEGEAISSIASRKSLDDQSKASEAILNDFFRTRPDPETPLSDEEYSFVNTLSANQFRTDKRVALEEQYAEKYVTTSLSQAAEDNEEIAEVLQEQPEKSAIIEDAAIKDVITGRLIHNELERLAARDENNFKVLSDYIEKLVPFKETYEIFSLNEDLPEAGLPDESIIPGRNRKEKFDYFYSLPTEAQAELLPQITDALADRNSLTAALFLTQLLSYPMSEERFENLIASLDLVDVTTTTGVLAGGAKLFGLFKTLQSIQRGSLRRPVGVHRGLDAIGDVVKASHLRVKERIRRKANSLPETSDLTEVYETVPSLFNPRSVLEGSDSSLSALDQARLLTVFQKNATNLLGGVDDTLMVRRLRAGDIDAELLAARAQVTKMFPRLEDKIVSAKLSTPASKTLTGNDVVEVQFGDFHGELFTNKRTAENTAKKIYELTVPYEVTQIGPRYAISVKTAVDEKSPFITSLRLGKDELTPQSSSYVREAIRRFETPEDSFSKAGREDRQIAALGSSRLLGLTRAADEVFQGLSSGGRKRLSEFLNKERRHIDVDGNQARFQNNVGDLQIEWRKQFGESPSANEVAGYFTYRQLNDMDWTIRNFSTLGGKLRRNIKEVSVALPNSSSISFEGAPAALSDITNETAGVLVVRGNGQHTYLRTSTPEAKAEIERLVNKGGYQMVQTSPKGENTITTSPSLRKTVGSGGVDFVLAKKTTTTNLGAKQIDYAPGGHVVYDNGSFIVQPKLHREIDPNTNQLVATNYRGDNALLWFRTNEESRKYLPLVNEARKLLQKARGKDGTLLPSGRKALKDYLETNLPVWNVSKFRALFKEFNEDAIYSLGDDFETTVWGKTSAAHNNLNQKHTLFKDETTSSYNLYSDIPQRFLGERSLPLLTVKESGGYGTPTLRLDKAPILDAFPALERGLNSLAENKFLTDLKINAASRFVKEFGHLLSTPDVRAMEKNPIPHLFNPSWKAGADIVERKVAENYIRATKELLNVDNKTNKVLNNMKQNLADSIYRAGGQSSVDVADPLLSRIKEPTAFLRASAFHTVLGLFNPVHLFVQGTTFVHIAALGGLRNATAAAPAAWMMQWARQTLEPAILKEMSKKAAAYGWKPQHWEEANAALQRSGFGVLGKDQALLDDAFNPTFITNKGGRFLEASSVFFNGIERAIRHGAYATAYRKWRVVNPKAKFTDEVQRQVLADAQKFTVDMTANANASWQKGWPSIPTQFWSYATRMTEQFLSKRLTHAERARLLTFYGAVFGIPTSLAIPTNYPFSEVIRDELNKRAISVDDTVWETFRDGLPSAMLEYVTGTDFDLSGRLSPEGLGPGQTIRDILTDDKSIMEIVAGIGGGVLGEAVLSMLPPVYRYFALTGEDADKAPYISPEEARQIVVNVRSLKQLDRLFFALNYDSFYTKDGRPVAFSSPSEGVLTAIMGFQPDFVSQVYSLKRVTHDLEQFKRKVGDQVKLEFRNMVRALERNDVGAAHAADRTINAWFQGGGFSPSERSDLWQALLQQNKPLIDLIDDKYLDALGEKRSEGALLLDNLRRTREEELRSQQPAQE